MFKQVLNRLNISSALQKASIPNDLIPIRSDDKVGGELGKRFVEHLMRQIAEEGYAPSPASFVSVPKPGFTSRPAAVLTLVDRVMYEAVVEPLRTKLAKYLLDADIVMWPREQYGDKHWRRFESAPVDSNVPYIVQADVSGFYDSIDHQQLNDDLVKATGETELALSLCAFLSRVMGTKRGLPQGLRASDTLATTFLQPVDATLVRAGFAYWRHGDDVRIGAENYSRAREAIAVFESALRERGLLINASKCAILTRENYEEDLASGEAAFKAVRGYLLEARIEKVKSDSDEMLTAIKSANLNEQVGWDLFYHGTLSVDEVVSQLEDHLTPSDVEVAERLFLMTIEKSPDGSDPLPKEIFHQQLLRSLTRLTAARSEVALPHAASLLAKFPDKTEVVCTYLMAMAKKAPAPVAAAVQDVVVSPVFLTPWQQAWMYRVLALAASDMSPEATSKLQSVMGDESSHWMTRTEAMKALARANKLDKQAVTRLWNLSPEVYRVEVLSAVASIASTEEWAQRFLGASRLDPVQQVVVNHLIAERRAEGGAKATKRNGADEERRSVMDFGGAGTGRPGSLQGRDAQEYVNELRAEWDERDHRGNEHSTSPTP
jgi:hypothetical protein